MAESRRMNKSELYAHFAERLGIKPAEAGAFFDELLREFTFDKVPATPGHSCYGCALDEQACAVKVLNA